MIGWPTPQWIVETLVATTLLMLVVLLVRGAVARQFGPRLAYALWLLPALRMILPPLPAGVAPAPILPAALDIDIVYEASGIAYTAPSIDWPAMLMAGWLAGAALHFLWHLMAYWLFVRRTLGAAMPLPMLDRDGIEVCASGSVSGPFATGVFVKTIVLPLDYRRRYDEDELRLAMRHETAHHRRCDMSINIAALAMLSLHWFNPIAWRAHRAFRIDQEMACDAIVLDAATPTERHAYGRALLKSTCDRLPMAACALGAGEDLKRRLKMMTSKRPGRWASRTGSLLAVTLTAGGLLLTASGGIAADTTREMGAEVKLAATQVAQVVVPKVPPAPAAPAAPATPPAPEAQPAPAARAVPSVPPAPPAPIDEAFVDRRAINAEIEASMRDARADIAEAQHDIAEARHDVAEARRDALHAAAEARAEAHAEGRSMQVIVRDCGAAKRRSASVTTTDDHDGHVTRRITVCGNGGIDEASMNKTVITALEGARIAVLRMDGYALAHTARAQALAEIDRKLAALKAK